MIIVACKNCGKVPGYMLNRSNFCDPCSKLLIEKVKSPCEAAAQKPEPGTFAVQLRSITQHKLEFDAELASAYQEIVVGCIKQAEDGQWGFKYSVGDEQVAYSLAERLRNEDGLSVIPNRNGNGPIELEIIWEIDELKAAEPQETWPPKVKSQKPASPPGSVASVSFRSTDDWSTKGA